MSDTRETYLRTLKVERLAALVVLGEHAKAELDRRLDAGEAIPAEEAHHTQTEGGE